MLKKSPILSSLLFWLLFILLNSLLFLPELYVDSRFVHPVAPDTQASYFQLFWLGDPHIIWKLSVEFCLLFLPALFFKKDHWSTSIYLSIAAIGYLFLLYFHLYVQGYKAAYSIHPIFANDWVLIKEILPTFLKEISVKGSTYLGIVMGIIAVSILLVLLLIFAIKQLLYQRKKLIFWSFGGLSMFFIFYSFSKENPVILEIEDPIASSIVPTVDSTLQDSILWLNWTYPDIQKSATLDREDHLKHLKKRWIYDFYKNKKLKKKPNVYLLFLESYGGVATISDYCEAPYTKLAKQLTHQLDSAGWFNTSNYSKSTVIGGRSWLAMTTAMIGARIEDQIQYSELLKNQQTYPHMVDFFNRQGYETYRMSMMRVHKIDTLNMITIPNQFWHFDHRFFFPDISYRGFRYERYFGGIPDQYSLGYANDVFLKDVPEPHFFTLITMNSHGPWQDKPPPIVEDWRSLNELKDPFNGEPIIADMSIQKYWINMDYQLRMITDFILKKGKENSIYIILGDHNPGGLEFKLYKKFNKWATPIHIVSKDSSFIESFDQFGFTPGIKVDTSQYDMMRHMGLYSLLTRQLLDHYGEPEVVLPEYLPWGL